MSRGYSVKTPGRVAEAQRLRAEEHLPVRLIAQRLGCARATVQAWLNDPDGTWLRARKDSYAGVCVDCGAPTSGSEGRRAGPLCNPCASVRSGAEAKVWTREAIVLAIQEWAAKYGEPPASPDWCAWRPRHEYGDEARAQRYEREHAAGTCPTFGTAVAAFGSWNAAIVAAGFTPRPAHGGGVNTSRRRDQRAKRAA